MKSWFEVSTAGDTLVRAASRWPDLDALIFPDYRATYAQMLERSTEIARSLMAIGVAPREHVALLMPNCPDMLQAIFGCFLMGAIPVPINARFKSYELGHVLADAEAVAVLTTDLISEYADFVELLDGIDRPLPALRTRVMMGTSAPDGMMKRAAFLAAGNEVAEERVDALRTQIPIRAVAMMLYTSGTTANPKGCPLSHESIVRIAIAVQRRLELTTDDRMWDPLPMFHAGAILPFLACSYIGAAFVSQLHFKSAEALRMIAEEHVTFLYPLFPLVNEALLNDPGFATTDLSRVRASMNVAPPDVLKRSQAALPHAVQLSAYGITEGGGIVAYNYLSDTLEQRTETCGTPLDGLEVRVVDPETGVPVLPGVRGEIVIRGYGVFEGYHHDPAKTGESFDADGWFHTGDLGHHTPDGRLVYIGRTKDMLKVGGENVAAAEVESLLSTHAAVKIAQVVGVPDSRLQEVPAAFVEFKPGAAATESELIEFCRSRIASFKVPRYVRIVSEWPTSATKIQKYRLREQLMAELESAASGALLSASR
jgi:acyl-CoA synthetase (AMP-forming)/AMP-acid ligase II